MDATTEEIERTFQLVYRLRDTPVLTSEEANQKSEARMNRTWEKMVTRGLNYGQATGDFEWLDRPEDQFRTELRNTNNDLAVQIDRVNKVLDAWFEYGEFPAPYYFERVAIILRKLKQADLEKAFLAVTCLHFGHLNVGGRWAKIQARAIKCGAWVGL